VQTNLHTYGRFRKTVFIINNKLDVGLVDNLYVCVFLPLLILFFLNISHTMYQYICYVLFLTTQKTVELCPPQHVKCERGCFLLFSKVTSVFGERLSDLTVPSLYVFFICTMLMYWFCMYFLCVKSVIFVSSYLHIVISGLFLTHFVGTIHCM
jgi:hypothetical protein